MDNDIGELWVFVQVPEMRRGRPVLLPLVFTVVSFLGELDGGLLQSLSLPPDSPGLFAETQLASVSKISVDPPSLLGSPPTTNKLT